MSEQITVTLPDGSSREYEPGTTAADVAASIGRGLAKAAVAAKVGDEFVDLSTPLDHDAAVAIVVARLRRGARGAAPLHRACARGGGHASVPRRAVRDRARDRGRLLLRLRAPGWSDVRGRRPGAHRRRDAQDRQGRRALRARRALLRRRARRSSPTSRTSRRSSRRSARARPPPRTRARSAATAVCRCTATSATAKSSSPTCAVVRTSRRRSASVRSS